MKIRIMSDVHFTDGINGNLKVNHSAFNSYFGKMLKQDDDCVTLIAGDMATGLDYTQAFLEKFFPNQQVIFIEGNHLVYQKGQKTIYELQDELRNAYPKTHMFWHYLENNWMFLPNSNDSVAVIGSTFFTNYEYTTMTVDDYNESQQNWARASKLWGVGDGKYEPVKELSLEKIIGENMLNAEYGLNDFRWGFETPTRNISPKLYLELHNKAKDEVKRCYDEIMAINPNCKVILMTHHCLSPKCIEERYVSNKMNASYISDLEDWVNGFENIKLVISGHVHCRKDFKFGDDKRYIINACGYCAYQEPWKEPKFNPNLIIDTDEL